MPRSDRPQVSVIVGFFNDEKFLPDAIESVAAQKFTDWELLLVDDGSTDGSTAVARSWVARYPTKIRYLEHPEHQNRGISATRNLGLSESRGEFVALLDSDDIWLPGKLGGQVSILEENPTVAMTYCRSLYWWSWDKASSRQDELPAAGAPEDCIVAPPGLLSLFVSNKAMPALPCSLMFRLEAARTVGGFEESFPGLYEDQVFTAKIAAEYPIWASSECSVKYRQHAGSITAAGQQVGQSRMAVARARYLEWLGDYMRSISLEEAAVWREWSRQAWMYRHFEDEDRAIAGSTRLDAWRWVKKWILRSEEAILPAGVRRHLWRKPDRSERG